MKKHIVGKRIAKAVFACRMKVSYCFLGACLLCFPILFGKAFGNDRTGLKMTGLVQDGKVSLRWAATSPETWKTVLEKGFILEKYIFDTALLSRYADSSCRDGIWEKRVVRVPAFVQLDTAVLSAMADTCAYAAVLGEAVYAPFLSFSQPGDSVGLSALSDRVEERKMRYVLAHLAYDRSFSLACRAGMGWVDTQVSADKYYLYRLYPASMQETGDTAVYFARAQDRRLLPPAQKLQSVFKDDKVELTWNQFLFENICTGYYIERAEKKRWGEPAYERLNDIPYMALHDSKGRMLTYTDSIPDKGKEYVYRIKGIDVFGNEFPVAQGHYGRAGAGSPAFPRIDSVKGKGKDFVEVYWSLLSDDPQALPKAVSLYVSPSPAVEADQAILLRQGISVSRRKILVETASVPMSSYFFIRSDGFQDEKSYSLPFFYQFKDSVAPDPPQKLDYRVDSSGMLFLTWAPSPQTDVVGYRVYWKIGEESEWVQLTKSALRDTSFVDTISLRTSQNFFYAVAAEDRFGNLSLPSIPILVSNGLPDIPVPPCFSFDSYQEEKGVRLVWHRSPSEEVEMHVLFVRCDSAWQEVARFPAGKQKKHGPTEEYYYVFDASAQGKKEKFQFKVTAYGKNKQTDTASTPFFYSVERIVDLLPPVLQLYADRQRHFVHLQWKISAGEEYRKMLIFRRSDGCKAHLVKALGPEEIKKEFYVDSKVQINNRYEYFIQTADRKGRWSSYSRIYAVEY